MFFRSSHPEVFCKISYRVLQSPKRFLEILENSQESTCESLFIDKVAGQGWQHYLKRDPRKGASCEFCKIWKNTFSYRTPLVAASSFLKWMFL